MFLELIGTFFAGFAAAGIAMALGALTGGRLPRWLTPVAAGAGMIAVTIWMEYTWYQRTTANLPEGLEVAAVDASQQMWRPWTYLAPLVNRFWAVDVALMRTHEARPEQHIAEIIVMGRWRPIQRYPVLIDCAGGRTALLPPDVVFATDGTVEGAAWTDAGPEDPVLNTACTRRG